VKSVGRYQKFKMVRAHWLTPLDYCLTRLFRIRTAGLTDYEVRDLNDEINRLMREKRHWENQIVALGGANYRRNVAMLDDDGKEVPGTKGYKYAIQACWWSTSKTHILFSDTLGARKTFLVSVNFSKAVKMKRRKKTKPWPTIKSF